MSTEKPEMNPEELGRKIRTMRMEHHMTQAQLGEALGVTFQAVSKWENGRSVPDVLMLKKLCEVFGVSLNELLGNDDDSLDSETGMAKKKSRKLIWLVTFLAAAVILSLVLFWPKEQNDLEFRTLTSGCSAFSISGSLAVNKDQSYLYISDISYCGGEDDSLYQSIQCDLIQVKNDHHTVLSSETYTGSEPILLIDYLKTVQFKLNEQGSGCEIRTDSTLQIEITAVDESGQSVSYLIPVSSADDCSSTNS
jgi:transcriptional regulator with XRE-family HTH domain